MPVSTSRYSWRAICAVAQGPQNKAQQASSKPSTPVHLRADRLSEYTRTIVRRVVVVDKGDTGGLMLSGTVAGNSCRLLTPDSISNRLASALQSSH